MRHSFFVALLVCVLANGVAEAQVLEITVEGGKHELKQVPVCVPVRLTKEQAAQAAQQTYRLVGDGAALDAQFTEPGLRPAAASATKDGSERELHFILPDLKAGEKRVLKCDLAAGRKRTAPCFAWEPNAQTKAGLLVYREADGKDRPILRYMSAAYDNSSPEQRKRTYKVFHHLYDPAGTRLVTNGGNTDPYTDEKKLLYPHHRGLMFAFNRISYGDNLKLKADTWHAVPGDTHQEHVSARGQAGAVLGRHDAVLSWLGPKGAGDRIATEDRELTVYHLPGGTLVEFAARVKTVTDDAKVRLDGDPQHAGFQFRAANEVAEKSAKQTYYLRPDGKGELGATRNWDPKKGGPVDLPWDALSFVLGGKRYTVAYLNSPDNPKPSRFSERDYARFGCYFEHDLTAQHPLHVRYRLWLQDGEMTGAQVQALYDAFAHAPHVTVRASGGS